MTFPTSGVEVMPLVPPLVALVVGALSATAGVSGAFVLLPFQISVLGFASPAASATNLVYNLLAPAGGVYRYARERRLAWPLAVVILTGTVPGALAGTFVRIRFLPDPRLFKFLVGWLLLYIGARLACDALVRGRTSQTGEQARVAPAGSSRHPGGRTDFVVGQVRWTWQRLSYRFCGQTLSLSTPRLWPLTLLIGVASGAYGIGGGALISPLLASFFRLPIHTIAGAVLLSSFVTSVAAVGFYQTAATLHQGDAGLPIAPDWLLGSLFGLGGLAGTYLGARCQKYLPARVIRLLLAALLLVLAARYVGGFVH